MDDIWDDDAVEITRPTLKDTTSSRSRVLPSDSEDDDAPSHSRPSKRARTDKPLFNPGSDDEADPNSVLPPEIDALFDGLDDDDFVMGLPPQLDTAQLERDANKRARLETEKKKLARGNIDVLGELVDEGGNSNAKEKPAKQKRVVPKLDENRLLERDGLRALVQQSKMFKVKGKGHELSDLNRLMQMYQLWAHKMFPKMQFNDTVERVERLCRTKRMHVALSTWRDEFAGIDKDTTDNVEAEELETDQAVAQHPPTSSPARITLEPGGPSIRQSQAQAEPNEDEEEMWRDMMEAMESQQNQTKEKETTIASTNRRGSEEQLYQYDEEDWAVMDEMEQELDTNKPSGSKLVQDPKSSNAGFLPNRDHDVSSDVPPDPSGPSEDEDDFYAMYEP